MNAYKLADLIGMCGDGGYNQDAANMLRQQADRIAHLEMLVANRNEIIDKLDLTMPQIKELSDEEIIEVFESPFHKEPTGKIDDEVIAFARAILKKASEK